MDEMEIEKITSQVTVEFKQQGDNSSLDRLFCRIVAVNVRSMQCWRPTSQEVIEVILVRKDESMDYSGGNVSLEEMG